jgi:signal transduction histidine kinase
MAIDLTQWFRRRRQQLADSVCFWALKAAFLEKKKNLHRTDLLVVANAVIMLNSFGIGIYLDNPFNSQILIYEGFYHLALLPFTWVSRWHVVVSNLWALGGLVSMWLCAQNTGGIESQLLLWISMLPVIMLLLVNLKTAIFWLCLVILAHIGMYGLTVDGKVQDLQAGNVSYSFFAFISYAGLLVYTMLGVRLNDVMLQNQIHSLAEENKKLLKIQKDLRLLHRSRDEFVASVGHEMRTPMVAILGFNSAIQKKVEHASLVYESSRHIEKSTKQLLKLINNILDYSQMQAGRLSVHLEATNPRRVVEEVVSLLMHDAELKGIDLKVQIKGEFQSIYKIDYLKLKKILENLIENALKFTDKGLVLIRLIDMDDWIRIEISDTGIGIPKADQFKIFNRFEMGDVKRTQRFAGTGLGLAIAKGFVHLLDGSMGVVSDEGKGALFWFEIPANKVGAHIQLESNNTKRIDAEDVHDRASLLLVDDNRLNLMVAEMQMRKCFPKVKVKACLSAEAAIQAMGEQAFDVALIDLDMPDMNGLDLARWIRRQKDERTSHMPIAAFTANADGKERIRCLNAGMNDVLIKPVEEIVLRQRVGLLLDMAFKRHE